MSRIVKIKDNEILENLGFRDGRRTPNFSVDFDEIDGLDRPEYEADVTRKKQQVKCVVDINGGGDFSELQSAVTYTASVGGGVIYLKEGIYTLTEDLELFENIELQGISPQTTIINFAFTNSSIKIYGRNAYTTGTISATAGSTTITGVGTSWSSNLQPGYKILLGKSNWFNIVSVDSDTQVTIQNPYFGENISGETYVACQVADNVSLNHIAVAYSGTHGIDCKYTNNVKMFNVFSLYNVGHGIKFETTNWNILDYVISAYNTLDGVYIDEMYNSACRRFFSFSNTRDGISIVSKFEDNSFDYVKVFNNTIGIKMDDCDSNTFQRLDAQYNSDDGIQILNSDTLSVNTISKENGGYGIYIYLSNDIIISNSLIKECDKQEGLIYIVESDYVVIDGCHLENNTAISSEGLAAEDSNYVVVDNCIIKDNDYGISIVENGENPIDCIVSNCVFNGCTINLRNLGGIGTVFRGNSGVTVSEEIDSKIMQNVSGGALARGDLVVFDPSSTGAEVTTTTSQGDDLVFGVVSQNIADDGYGRIQTLGYFEDMKVDGTTDIAVGDFLGTFTTAKIGMKAGAGDMAIAIALEAYTTDDSNGLINVLLITPRKL